MLWSSGPTVVSASTGAARSRCTPGPGAGTLLFTTGGGSVDPVPMLGNANAAAGALRNRVTNLNRELAGRGAYAAHVAINV